MCHLRYSLTGDWPTVTVTMRQQKVLQTYKPAHPGTCLDGADAMMKSPGQLGVFFAENRHDFYKTDISTSISEVNLTTEIAHRIWSTAWPGPLYQSENMHGRTIFPLKLGRNEQLRVYIVHTTSQRSSDQTLVSIYWVQLSCMRYVELWELCS